MILVDTSVWVDHLRRGDAELAAALDADEVVTHPFVIGELACGNLKSRAEVLSLLNRLPRATPASDAEVLRFLEGRALMGRGVGYLDLHLLAAAALSAVKLWTRNKWLAGVAGALNLAFAPG